MAISWELERHRDLLLVRLRGEMDIHTADSVRRMLQSELDKGTTVHLLLNLGKLTFMDSSGLGVILGRYRTLQQTGGQLFICDVPPAVRRLLELSGVHKLARIFSTEEEALQSIGVMSREK
jgi:stage II sporulation protein AA (anti-sigma F factor antagonist)